jgi:hypothetical protein
MTFASCAACTASASVRTSRAASLGCIGVPANFLSRPPPAQNSRLKNGLPSCSPISWTATMFGCCKRAMASASVRKRFISSSPAWVPLRIIFNATCRARYTTPMPPRPSSPSTS